MSSKEAAKSLLRAENISLSFGGLKAVSNATIEVRPAEILAIIGPNGAGKTSLFNVLTGIYRPTSGCMYAGQDPLEERLGFLYWIKSILLGALIAAASSLMIFISPLWDALINKQFIWGTPFDWNQFGQSFWPALIQIGGSSLVWVLIALWAVSIVALWSINKEFCFTPAVCSKKGLARTFQNIRLFKKLSVLDNVVLGLRHSTSLYIFESLFFPFIEKRHTHTLELQAMKLLEQVGLLSQKDKLADELSYGNKRRLEIARALASDPKILLLDEPAAGLNPTEGQQLSELIYSIKNSGISVVLIEHHMKVVMKISDRIVVLHQGEVFAEGTPEEIRNNDAVIGVYLGGSKEVHHDR